MSVNVIHISPTPLVGAPAKVTRVLNTNGFEALHICLRDYPSGGPLSGKFIADSLIVDNADDYCLDSIDHALAQADIIHVHNDLPAEQQDWIQGLAPRAAYVYQVHSPLGEGPLYYERAKTIRLPFRARLVVGQYQPRHYPDYAPVPNLVLDQPTINLRKQGEPLRVLFSPSHTRGGRWNSKCSDSLMKILEALATLGKIELVTPEKPLSPSTLMFLRKTCHVTIDEIVTGAFHQVSLEGLCAGNIVVNRADFFCRAMMAQCADTEDLPPFTYADEQTAQELLINLSDDFELTRRLQQESYDYYCEHLRPEALIKPYIEVYDNVL